MTQPEGKSSLRAHCVCLLYWFRKLRNNCCFVQMWRVLCCFFLLVIAQLESSCPPLLQDYCWIHTQSPLCPCILLQSVMSNCKWNYPALSLCAQLFFSPHAETICWSNRKYTPLAQWSPWPRGHLSIFTFNHTSVERRLTCELLIIKLLKLK